MTKKKHTGSSGRRKDGRKGFIIYLLPEEKAALQQACERTELGIAMGLSGWIRTVVLTAAGSK